MKEKDIKTKGKYSPPKLRGQTRPRGVIKKAAAGAGSQARQVAEKEGPPSRNSSQYAQDRVERGVARLARGTVYRGKRLTKGAIRLIRNKARGRTTSESFNEPNAPSGNTTGGNTANSGARQQYRVKTVRGWQATRSHNAAQTGPGPARAQPSKQAAGVKQARAASKPAKAVKYGGKGIKTADKGIKAANKSIKTGAKASKATAKAAAKTSAKLAHAAKVAAKAAATGAKALAKAAAAAKANGRKPVTMAWSCLGEIIFNLPALTGAINMAGRVAGKMFDYKTNDQKACLVVKIKKFMCGSFQYLCNIKKRIKRNSLTDVGCFNMADKSGVFINTLG